MSVDGARALAVDLDGTLIDMNLKIDPRDIAALGRALEAGIRVIACTGRPFPGARPWVLKLGLRDPIVCYQGAQVRALDGDTLLDAGVKAAVAKEVIAFARSRDVHVQAYRDDRLLVERDRPEAHEYARHAGMEITMVADLNDALGPTTPKLVMVAAPERVEALLPLVRQEFGDRLFVTTSLPNFLELTELGADKGRALRFLAGELGISPERSVAVGDGRNDVPMLKWAGMRVAVEGAPPELASLADRIIPAPGGGGIASLVEELLGS